MSSASIANRKSQTVNFRAFTLIELLVVISIIALIAALIFPVAGSVKRLAAIQNAQAEMAQLETAIDRYKSAYGFYPPDSTTTVTVNNIHIPINQLYYELEGTVRTNISGTDYFVTLDSNAKIAVNLVSTAFGANVNGFMNCSKTNADESTPQARNFLPDLKPDRIGMLTITDLDTGKVATISNLITSVGGPSINYKPLGVSGMNPWRYNSSNPTNNPGSYDLWVQLVFGGQTNLVCDWNKRVQLNSPLP